MVDLAMDIITFSLVCQGSFPELYSYGVRLRQILGCPTPPTQHFALLPALCAPTERQLNC